MTEWWQWLIVCGAAFLIGFSKTGIAGVGMLGIALATGALPARESVGTVLITLIAGDIIAVSSYRREVDWSQLWKLFPWAAVGVVIGALIVGQIDNNSMRRIIGGILLALMTFSIIRRFLQARAQAEPKEPGPQAPWVAPFTGIMAGITTMAANASGPIMAVYLLAQRLPKLVFIGTGAWFFLALNLFKVPFSIGLGMITNDSAMLSLPLIPCTIVGGLIGRWLIQYVDEKRFEQITLILTFLASLRLLF